MNDTNRISYEALRNRIATLSVEQMRKVYGAACKAQGISLRASNEQIDPMRYAIDPAVRTQPAPAHFYVFEALIRFRFDDRFVRSYLTGEKRMEKGWRVDDGYSLVPVKDFDETGAIEAIERCFEAAR